MIKWKKFASSSSFIVIMTAIVLFIYIQKDSKNQIQDGSLQKSQANKIYGLLPMHFEMNHGQLNEQVKFIARGRGYTLFLTPDEAILSLRRLETGEKIPQYENVMDFPVSSNQQSQIDNPKSNVVHIKLPGSNSSPQIKGIDKLTGKSNYFKGRDAENWYTDIPNYAKVRYTEVYPSDLKGPILCSSTRGET